MNTPSATEIRRQQIREEFDFIQHARVPDPKDATIAALAQEVERLAKTASGTAQHGGWSQREARSLMETAESSRALLRRLGLALATLMLASGLYAAPKPHRHVTKPLSTITVKVVPHAAFLRVSTSAPWRITTQDLDGCTAWVDTQAPDVAAAELAALRGCRSAIDLAVDAAAEKGGR